MIYRSLSSQADVDRLYVKKSHGGRGFSVNIEVGILYQYVVNSPERLLMVTKDENVVDKGLQKESIYRRWLSSYIIEKRYYTGSM